ncbi:protein S100-A12-like [Nycticebus coucang]|uniref:protein S100-A12-like n=1 Tax=Nycticebus coucang TaxID=9470 RepID=UPI00234D529A|nr:protein S100-A12-like [Nycticebus coucang]XP_053441773.1 protein S100-A12-like [Nycticebus coucang]XP_053441774.1 protein S100-A12-like [Nycticebus coucang]
MSKLEEHLEGIVNIFHQYSVLKGHYDTLTKGEMKQLLTKELANITQNARDRGGIDKIFEGLDANRDQVVDFVEFMTLVAILLRLTHEEIHKP